MVEEPMTTPASTQSDERALQRLSRQECIDALQLNHIGRVVTTIGPDRRPFVRPVSYLYDAPSNSIVFQSAPGTKLHTLIERGDASFEIDGESGDSMWSVIVRGRVEIEEHPREIARFQRGVSPALSDARSGSWVRVRAEVISGVRFPARD
jgi:uncharacterized protein